MKNLYKIFPLLITAALYANVAWSDEAMVIEVIDGDTILVQEYGRKREIDIKRIDAPELSQPFGPEAKEALEKILLNQVVRIDDGNVFSPGKNRPVSWELIENGLAWCENRIDRNDPIKSLSLQQDSMCTAELQARQKKLGLWSQASEPPWAWKSKQSNSVTKEYVHDREAAELSVWQKEKARQEAKAKAEEVAEWERNNPEAVALKKIQDELQKQTKLIKQQNRKIDSQATIQAQRAAIQTQQNLNHEWDLDSIKRKQDKLERKIEYGW